MKSLNSLQTDVISDSLPPSPPFQLDFFFFFLPSFIPFVKRFFSILRSKVRLWNSAPAVKYYGGSVINQRACVCTAAVNTLSSRMCALAYASITETDGGGNKKPGGKKFVPSNILVIHSQNVTRSDALAPKSEIFPTKSNICLRGSHSGSIHPCCSEVITCRRHRAAA